MSRRATSLRADSGRVATKCQDLGEQIQAETLDLAKQLGMESDSLLDSVVHKKLSEQVDRLARADAMLELKVSAVAKAMNEVSSQVEVDCARNNRENNAAYEEDVKDYAAQLLAKVTTDMKGADKKAVESDIYKNVMKQIKVFGGDDDDGLFIVNAEKSLICPLTNAQFRKPVKSRKCNHTYEDAAIKNHIKIGKGNPMCPVAGCAHHVTRNDLKDDTEMERQLRIARLQPDQEPVDDTGDIDDDTPHETYV